MFNRTILQFLGTVRYQMVSPDPTLENRIQARSDLKGAQA
jgi:hypothetical protein